ncbi:hypothetical protein C0992_005538 [Termitomyces sp. T32_za158]|nr:hypothetical protein C0992_005538 [Termitomyces sp. T32_za158]
MPSSSYERLSDRDDDASASGSSLTLSQQALARPDTYYGEGPFDPPSSDDEDDKETGGLLDKHAIPSSPSLAERGGVFATGSGHTTDDDSDLKKAKNLFSSHRFLGVLLFIILLGAFFIGYSAARSYKTAVSYHTGSRKFTMDHMFNNTFRVDRKTVNWVPEAGDGVFSLFEGGDLKLVDLKTNTIRVLVSSKDIKDENGQQLTWFSWKLSPDMKYVLLKAGYRKQWRWSTFGNYYVHNIVEKTTFPVIPPTYPSNTAYATWAPHGHSIAYVTENDLYVLSTPTYGGPNSQMVDLKFARTWHDYLACGLSYIIVTVDGRGTGYKGRHFRNPVKDNLGFYETIDQINAAKIWAAKEYVDRKRIGIWGWSYGGFMASKVVEANAGVHSLSMAIAPVTSWRLYGEHMDASRHLPRQLTRKILDSIYTERYMNLPQLNPGGYINASVSNVTGFHNVEFLLAHGSGDDNVHYANSAHLLDMFTEAQVRNFRFRMFTDRMMPAPAPRKRERPKGLWKARVMPPRLPAGYGHERKPSGEDFESDNGDDDASLPSSSSSQASRRSPSLDLGDIHKTYYWNYSRGCSPDPSPISNWETAQKAMDVSSIAGSGISPENPSWTYEDWEDLKELFIQANDQFENAGAAEALPIIRGVIHECHRFMVAYPDPSGFLISSPSQFRLSDAVSSPDEAISSVLLSPVSTKHSKRKNVELPTAFHVILGTVLFMFGNIIDQDPEQAAPGEPNTPLPYWLSALDVFETGDNLPVRTSGRGAEIPDDWQLAVIWGRTLVALAEQMVTCEAATQKEGQSATSEASVSQLFAEDPEWPPESPFSMIVRRRPPFTRRMTLSSATPNELMVLAMDQFSRGIFRMPHHAHQAQTLPIGAETFSRAKELFQIASEVLSVAEKLASPTERRFWATWADSIFNQMKMEADMDAWRGPINRARGRCWLVVGSARAEEFESLMEASDASLVDSPEAREARDGLLKALAFFERAKGSANFEELSDEDAQELRKLLAETLLDLGNLAQTTEEQEKYYTRAQEEGGQDYLMDEGSDFEHDSDGDELMRDS